MRQDFRVGLERTSALSQLRWSTPSWVEDAMLVCTVTDRFWSSGAEATIALAPLRGVSKVVQFS
jgi:hypothetical protein